MDYTEKKIDEFRNELVMEIKKQFNKAAENIKSENKSDEDLRYFELSFSAYNFVMITILCEKNTVCSYIKGDAVPFILENSQTNLENFEIERFVNELHQEIEIRIPEKYLIKKGYLNNTDEKNNESAEVKDISDSKSSNKVYKETIVTEIGAFVKNIKKDKYLLLFSSEIGTEVLARNRAIEDAERRNALSNSGPEFDTEDIIIRFREKKIIYYGWKKEKKSKEASDES